MALLVWKTSLEVEQQRVKKDVDTDLFVLDEEEESEKARS